MTTCLREDRGFSLIELLAVMAFAAIIFAMAVPSLRRQLDSMRLGEATRTVERELQSARLRAVTSNRRLRVRPNCPAAGSLRMVEVLGTAADTAANRCAYTAYPYPPPDTDPVTVPNLDGPIRPIPWGATVTNTTIEFRPDGTAWSVDGTGTAQAIPAAGTQLTVTRNMQTKAISVNALGKIAIL